MFKTCMFCKKSLGSNEVLETFPVGRRLAFDSAKGRLWVVCTKCRRWNLTPLEERWEAVEDCERLFRATPMRASTENIGIARHRGGLDLVRIGRPRRGEFAAWRYGNQFKRRYRLAAVSSVGFFGLGFGFSALPIAIPTGLVIGGTWAAIAWSYMRPLAKVRVGAEHSDGRPVNPDDVAVFRLRALRSMRLLPDEDASGFMVEVKKGRRKAGFRGEDARRVAAALIPRINQQGGTRHSIKLAVQQIESSGHPERFLTEVASREHQNWIGSMGVIRSMPAPTRLALEMSLHEEQERRALEGELWILEQAWKEAEEIAAISDSLLLPAGTDAFFDRYGEDER
ncbi:MAG: hypothetical protein F4Z31_19560 [Gemmatimonadetes bacterium]|nr:hypothetical protein [Gemmatimonadota bacterium]MYA43931.1 hypothetical protein [Gemmatimonadota bacterium]MYE93086.1 hypothetical protein [Gemmatimonadota bacterium]MYJ09656.1 hypothetical protein [Gemmatimonadota bacterium]